jgi:hypothetical protein
VKVGMAALMLVATNSTAASSTAARRPTWSARCPHSSEPTTLPPRVTMGSRATRVVDRWYSARMPGTMNASDAGFNWSTKRAKDIAAIRRVRSAP